MIALLSIRAYLQLCILFSGVHRVTDNHAILFKLRDQFLRIFKLILSVFSEDIHNMI